MELSLLNLLFVLLAGWLAGSIAARYGYPSVLGELIAGIILGPPLLGLLYGSEALEVLAEVGVLLMMLYIGMEIDPRELFKASWAGLLAAIGGFVTPFVLAYFVVIAFGGSTLGGLFVAIAAGVTSLLTKSRILVDLKLLDTRVAHVMLAGALVSDTLSLVVFAAVLGVVEAGTLQPMAVLWVAIKALLFFGVTMLFGLKVFPSVGQRLTRAGLTDRTFNFTLVLLIAVLFGEAAELAGLHAILGAFIAGLFLRENVLGKTLSHDLMGAVREASIGFLAPIFFVTAGFAVTLDVFRENLPLLLSILAVATFGKILGTALFYLPTGNGWREGLTIGGGMNGRGAVEIIIAGIGLEAGLISQEIFSILVFMAIFTTATVPFALKWGTEWLRRRGELVRSSEERRGTLILGAGPIARLLGQVLSESRPVWLVDSNQRRCEIAAAEGLSVVRGNALQEQSLSEANAAHADSVIALTSNAEVNALAAQIARNVFLVPDVHVLEAGEHGSGRTTTLEHLKATTLFGGPVNLDDWDHWIARGQVEQTTVPVTQVLPAEAIYAELQTARASLPLAIQRDGERFPFHSASRLQPGDEILVIQTRERRQRARDRFDQLATNAPVLDLETALSADEFFDVAAKHLSERLDIDPDILVTRLRHRERSGSTVISPGLAIPHVVIDGQNRFDMLIARCREGVLFSDPPTPVHAVFVLVGTEDQRTLHLRALSAIAQIVHNPSFEREWLSAEGPRELRTIISSAERRRL
jgi:Kef-type K+ transport system membrane component KefB/mannitol/fructose-specific phosphotransferase system IIA component (Ntr-type)